MSDFKRERRYLILKTKHLTQEHCQKLTDIADSVNHPPLECVVVESDWPNYEDTWQAIEQVANGEYQSPYGLIKQQQQRIQDLESAIADALYGELLDEHGNRDENGLLRVRALQGNWAIKKLEEQIHE